MSALFLCFEFIDKKFFFLFCFVSFSDEVVVRGTVWRGAVCQQGCSADREVILQIIKNENNTIEGQVIPGKSKERERERGEKSK